MWNYWSNSLGELLGELVGQITGPTGWAIDVPPCILQLLQDVSCFPYFKCM